ncbi:MAG: ABC transporter ATP-binding protein [Vicinamibacterales bacterium]
MRQQLRATVALVLEQRRHYAIGTVFVLIGIAAGLSYPLLVGRLIDDGVTAGSVERINQLGMILLGLLVAEGASNALRDYYYNVAAERATARLRRKVFDRLLRLEIAFFDGEKTGELTSRLSSDVPAIARVIGDELADGVRFLVFGLAGTALLFYTSFYLTLLVMLAVPPIIIVSSVLGKRVKVLSSQMQQAFSESGAAAEESLAGIRTVRAFSQEAAEGHRYGGKIAAALALARRKILTTSALSGLSFTFAEGAALLALWSGGYLIARGQLTSGQLITFVLYAFLVSRGFRNATAFYADALRGLGATQWIFAMLEREPAMPIEGGHRLPQVVGAVDLEGVRFTYPTRPDTRALDGIDLSIRAGEVVAFVGRSGAGKSTMLNLLLRFYDPDEGRVALDGHDLRELDPSWLRQQIGVVLQEPVLFSGSVADNIRYGRPEANDADVLAAAELAAARGFIERFPDGFETAIGDRGVQLSGGQRQRLAIARAVLRRPAILILDEATSALDSESESFVHDALRALDYGPTTIVIAHRLSTVVNVNRVIVLDHGRIIGIGRHDELLQSCPLYRQLVETQLVAV